MARPHYIIRLLHNQRGAAAIWFVLCLPVLLGFAALAVDLARINLVKVELQNAADAAALAGARSLSDTQPPPGPSDKPYNWSAATATALDVARRNVANAARIRDVIIETGYWNLQNPTLGLRQTSAPVNGDVPAVHATVTLSSTQNNGPLRLFFAPILGIAEHNVQASAIAVIAPPAAGTHIFPFVIGKKMLDHYWNLNTRTPVLVNGVAPTINLGSVYTFNNVSVLSGQWTTFDSSAKNPSVTVIRGLIQNGNSTPLSIGQNTYIQPGAKATLYSEVPVGQDVALFVVDNVVTDSFQPIVAIAGFHISGYNQGGKYIEGHFINNVIIGSADPGTGNGVPYGAYSSPISVY
jgi:Flp pilus assembly protein TadG